jgi:hypothetical protein
MKKYYNNPVWAEYQQDMQCVKNINQQMHGLTKKEAINGLVSIVCWAISFGLLWFFVLPFIDSIIL